jgi:hypothetical protein
VSANPERLKSDPLNRAFGTVRAIAVRAATTKPEGRVGEALQLAGLACSGP